MPNTRYTKDHEWIRLEGDAARSASPTTPRPSSGDVVFVELPAIGTALDKGAEAAVVESVKAASDVYAPVAGEVVAVNDRLVDAPGIVNEDAEGKGWFFKLKVADPAELESLMTAEQYKLYIETIS